MKFYKNSELSADVVFVNDVSFVASVSENSHYGTIRAVNNLRCASLEIELKTIIRSHAMRGSTSHS